MCLKLRILMVVYTLRLNMAFCLQRQSIAQPTKPCTSSNEGESIYKALHADMIWICKSKQWIPYK